MCRHNKHCPDLTGDRGPCAILPPVGPLDVWGDFAGEGRLASGFSLPSVPFFCLCLDGDFAFCSCERTKIDSSARMEMLLLLSRGNEDTTCPVTPIPCGEESTVAVQRRDEPNSRIVSSFHCAQLPADDRGPTSIVASLLVSPLVYFSSRGHVALSCADSHLASQR